MWRYVVVFWLVANVALAGEVKLKNGDKLTGTVTAVEKDKLVLDTSYAKGVKIDLSQVATVSMDKPVKVHLEGGDVLTGKITGVKDGNLLLNTAHSGVISVSLKAVGSVKAGETQAAPKKDEEKLENLKKRKWEGAISLAGSHTSGNTDKTGIDVGVQATRETEDDRFTLKAQYHRAEDTDVITSESLFGLLKYDYFFAERTYWYLSNELLSDEFRDLNLQSMTGGGIGRKLIDTENFKLEAEAGIVYKSIDHIVADDVTEAAGRGALKVRWKLFKGFSFEDDFTIFPSLETMGDYQYRNEAALLKDLGKGWSFKLANTLNHDSTAEGDTEKTDSIWSIGVQYKF